MNGPYIRIRSDMFDDETWRSDRLLARRVRAMIEEDMRRRKRRRAYIPRDIWRSILEQFGFACAYCGIEGVPLEKEHRMPLALGGPDDPTNLVPACRPCNRRKFVQHPDLWPLR